MEILRNNAAAIVLELETLGFMPRSRDKYECRTFDCRNGRGQTDLRVFLAFGDESTLNNVGVYGLDGSPGEIIEWNMEITGGTPRAPSIAFMHNP